jgi:hypothetical protein
VPALLIALLVAVRIFAPDAFLDLMQVIVRLPR